jgi:hypothetical protein
MASLVIIRGFFEQKRFISRVFRKKRHARNLRDFAARVQLFACLQSSDMAVQMQITFKAFVLAACGKTLKMA